MDVTYDNLSEFVRTHGSVTVLDTQRRARALPGGGADTFDVIAKADRFVFEGRWYSRTEFEILMDQQ
jgi:hypothetical protein